jgi:hypothetical protein
VKDPKPPITIVQACQDPAVFGRWFTDAESWAAWFSFLKSMFGLQLSDAELAVFQQCTNRSTPAAGGYLEATLVIGRRGGKSLILAVIAAFLAAFYDWSPFLTGGERGTIIIVATNRKQGRAIFQYLKEMLSIPLLSGMIERETADSVELLNGVTVEIMPANFRTIRGYTIVAGLLDELAFWPTDEGLANPDSEIVGAIRPAQATIPKAMLLKASSPYAKRGELWEDHKRYFGQENAKTLVWQASTATMNPTVPASFITAAYERDPVEAAAELGAAFRSDIESFVNREAVEGCVIKSRFELPPMTGVRYSGFVDPSGGSADSMTLAIAHREGDRAVVDAVREAKPPFSPEQVTAEFAALLKAYKIKRICGDKYAGQWPRERFEVHGIIYEPSAKPKSDLYSELLPLLNGCRVELLDHNKSIAQICSLERQTARSGKDSIDAPGHEDIANASGRLLWPNPRGLVWRPRMDRARAPRHGADADGRGPSARQAGIRETAVGQRQRRMAARAGRRDCPAPDARKAGFNQRRPKRRRRTNPRTF